MISRTDLMIFHDSDILIIQINETFPKRTTFFLIKIEMFSILANFFELIFGYITDFK